MGRGNWRRVGWWFPRLGLGMVLLLVAVTAVRVWWAPRATLAFGVSGYRRVGAELHATLCVTNTGDLSVALPWKFDIAVETQFGPQGVNCSSAYTLYLAPGQSVVAPGSNFLVRIPGSTQSWSLAAQVRPQTLGEKTASLLMRSGIQDWRLLSRLGGGPARVQDSDWTVCQGGPWSVLDTP